MKRMFTNRMALLIGLFLMSGFTQAQWVDWTWDQHGVGFQLPSDFRMTKGDNNSFEAQGDGMAMSIYLFNDSSLDNSDIISFTVDVAAEIGIEVVDDAYELELNGYEGAYIEGMLDGVGVMMMGLIDPNSSVNMYVIIAFDDRDQVAYDDGVSIFNSFHRM